MSRATNAKKWLVDPLGDKKILSHLKEVLGVNSVLAQLLFNRGIHDFDQAKFFFRPKWEDLHDPFLMKGMANAVNRIRKAIENNQSILVYGDYDVDGTTSVALMYTYLKTHTSHISYYIPDRYSEGYGISMASIDFARKKGIQLIIALDCGIRAVEQIAYAQTFGIDYIVCDHHMPGEKLPVAVAVLDPKQEDCFYPYSELSGCGVGFKLIQAIEAQSQMAEKQDLQAYLDLTAVSIAADIVPLTGENRILASIGMDRLRRSPREGLKVLIPQGKQAQLQISDVVFGMAPKINAAGRIAQASEAVDLLVEEDPIIALKKVAHIGQLNLERKELDKKITQEALALIEEEGEEKTTTVVYQSHWHKGVIGIVASRLIEQHYRPTVVFTKGQDGLLVASARSVSGFDVYAALDALRPLMVKFGGHKYAAGLSIKEEDFSVFKEAFEEQVSKTIEPEQKIAKIHLEASLSFKEIEAKFLRIVEQLAPFGPKNSRPIFYTEDVWLIETKSKTMGKEQEHLRLELEQGGIAFVAIAFGWGNRYDELKNQALRIAYSIEYNYWNGKKSLQLNIKDIQCSS